MLILSDHLVRFTPLSGSMSRSPLKVQVQRLVGLAKKRLQQKAKI